MSLLEQEIASIPTMLATCVEQAQDSLAAAGTLWRQANPAAMFTIARGTSDAAATYAAYRISRDTGRAVGSFTPSLASLHGFTHQRQNAVLALAISQSGASPDLVAALQAFAPELRLALTNVPASPLEQAACLHLPIGAGEEKSVAATKSFACSLMLLQALGATLGERAMPNQDAMAAAAQEGCAKPADLSMLVESQHCFVLGRSSTLAIAQEVALKLKEVAGLHAEALSAAEVHHGPKALAGQQMSVLALIPSGPVGKQVEEATAAMAAQGSETITLGSAEAQDEFANLISALTSFYTSLPAMARQRGCDPDHLATLSKVTLTT